MGAGVFEREIKFIVNGGEMDSGALRPWKQEVDHHGKQSNKLGASDVKEELPPRLTWEFDIGDDDEWSWFWG